MTGLAAGIGARASLGVVSAFFGKVPRWAWFVLIGAVALAGGLWWHHHAVKRHDKAIIAAERNRVEAIARTIIDKKNADNAKLSAELRSKSDAETTRIVTQYRDIVVRGPGAARCTSVPKLATTSGGHDATGGNGNASGPEVLADDRAAVPWQWLAQRAEQADLNRAEVLSWRDWYNRYSVGWAKWNAEAEKARKP